MKTLLQMFAGAGIAGATMLAAAGSAGIAIGVSATAAQAQQAAMPMRIAQTAHSPVAPRSPVPGYGSRSPVPNPGYGGGDWFGCASAQVHGSFNVRICANGNYRVVGGGLFCTGGLRHTNYGGRLNIQLFRTRCNQGTDWSGGSFVCGYFGGGRLSGTRCRFLVTQEARYNGWGNESVYFQ